jgi:uncharacterized protein (TIGR02147 family)
MIEKDISIIEYMDYRDFLSDYIETKKKQNPSYSMRAFAARLQCNAGQFTRILKGERNLTPAHAIEIGSIVKFSRKEKRYFELLISFNHAKKQSEREYFFDQMQQFRKSNIKEVSSDQYLLYSHWYYLVLRELLAICPCRDTSELECRKLSRLLNPPISHSEIREALETLLRLGVIEKKDNGFLGTADAFTASGEKVPQVITNRFLLEFTDLARRAVDSIPRNERRLSTLTFSISQDGFQKISERIDEFRRELLGLVEADSGKLEKVYHMNFQLFPVSKFSVESER